MQKRKQKIIVLFSAVFIFITNLSTNAQLAVPVANLKIENAVSLKLIKQIALFKAQELWGRVAPDKPIPCCDDDSDIVAYMVTFHFGSVTFPNYQEILQEIEAGRAAYDEATRCLEELQSLKNNSSLTEKTPVKQRIPQQDEIELKRRGFEIDSKIGSSKIEDTDNREIEKVFSKMRVAKDKMWGMGGYGSIYVSARSDRFPIPLCSHYLNPFYAVGDIAQKKAQNILGTQDVTLIHYYFLGRGRGQYFEFTSGDQNILIDAFSLEVRSPEKVLNRKGKKIIPTIEMMTRISEEWQRISNKL